MADSLTRFSISMKKSLLRRLDSMARSVGYSNRSQAIADIVRDKLIEHQGQSSNTKITGAITIVYDHHKRNIQRLLTEIQHNHGNRIIASLHVHLDHDNCMEILAVKGKAADVKQLADRLISAKGVKHGKLIMTTTGQEFKL